MNDHSKHIPRVRFSLPSLSDEAKSFAMFLTPRPTGWDWSEKIYEVHPELRSMCAGKKSKADRIRACLRYVRAFRKEHHEELSALVIRYQAEWDMIGPKFLRDLSDHFEIPYPSKRKVIRAHVSMVPIYPRWLDQWAFNVGMFRPERMKQIACHEILHFCYFEKWMEVFPKTRLRERDNPHLIWRLSEIIDPIILNEHPKLRQIAGTENHMYKEFAQRHIGDTPLPDFFRSLYRQHLRSGQPFSEFLKHVWDETIKHRKEIER